MEYLWKQKQQNYEIKIFVQFKNVNDQNYDDDFCICQEIIVNVSQLITNFLFLSALSLIGGCC